MKNSSSLTFTKAFKAMSIFLEKIYYQQKSDDLLQILSDIDLHDGRYHFAKTMNKIDTDIQLYTLDPAAKYDWLAGVEKFLGKNINELPKTDRLLSEELAFCVMIYFVKEFGERVESEEIRQLLLNFELNENYYCKNLTIRQQWSEAINEALHDNQLELRID